VDNYSGGGWDRTDYWGIFYTVHALLLAKDTVALPELRRGLVVLKKQDAQTKRYVEEGARGYASKLLLDERRAYTLVPDLERFLEDHPSPEK
jgi:hypothetical protein